MNRRDTLYAAVCCLLLVSALADAQNNAPSCDGETITVRTGTICNNMFTVKNATLWFAMSQDQRIARKNFLDDLKDWSAVRYDLDRLLDSVRPLNASERCDTVIELHRKFGAMLERNQFLDIRPPAMTAWPEENNNDPSDLMEIAHRMPGWTSARQINITSAAGLEYPRTLFVLDEIADRICARNGYPCKEPKRSFMLFFKKTWHRPERAR